jgi:hypothetical protein
MLTDRSCLTIAFLFDHNNEGKQYVIKIKDVISTFTADDTFSSSLLFKTISEFARGK